MLACLNCKATNEPDAIFCKQCASPLGKKKRSKLLAVVIALCALLTTGWLGLRVVMLGAYTMPAGSMMPTLLVGDHFYVNKLAREPVRGTMVAFKFPENPKQDFIKRVVAMPGDTVTVANGHLVIDGRPVDECKLGEYSYIEEAVGAKHDSDLYVEFLGEEAYLTAYDKAMSGFPASQGPWQVKAGEFWVMGDNRNNSHDSRMWFGGEGGGVPDANVRGRVLGHGGRPALPASAASLAPVLDACLEQHAAKK